MPTITIDQHLIEVPAGTTILDAARAVGIQIPTLCYLKGYEPSTSCQVCLVKDRANGRLLPSCATRVVEGMRIDSETDEVHAVRRTALELLFSDHVGDCLAPCYFACPAHMDIPLMLEQIGEHDIEHAIATIKEEIALPAVLGRVCSKPCEKGCRRSSTDGAVAVCDLKRFVADADLARSRPYRPDCLPESGQRVAIVGAGTTGLAAAYYLRQQGHTCVVFEKDPEPGGRLRHEPDEDLLPRPVLEKEIAQVIELGIDLRTQVTIDELDSLADEFDACLLSCGQVGAELLQSWGIKSTRRGIQIDRDTMLTNRSGIFAAGSAVRPKCLYVRSVADGKLAARAMHEFLSGQPITPPSLPFSSRMGSLQEGEAEQLIETVGHAPRELPQAGQEFTLPQAAEQSERCFACGCVSHGSCKLETYAVIYHADPTRYAGPRQPIEVLQRPGGIRFEPHKCIKCELCIQIAARQGEPLGLTFVGRGFDVRVAAPFAQQFEQGLTRAADDCVAACPTGALSFDRHAHRQLGHPSE